MTISIREILRIEELGSIKIIAGHQGLDKPVEYVNVMDTSNIADWLKGKELLLICGAFKSDLNIYKNIIKIAANKNVTAIGTKFAKCFEHIPTEMINQANEYNLPLLDIPAEFSWTDIMAPVYDAIIRKKTKAMERHDFLYDLLYGNIQSKELIVNKGENFGLNFNPFYSIAIYSINKKGMEDNVNFFNSKDVANMLDKIEYLTNKNNFNCVSIRKNHSLITMFPANTINNVTEFKKFISNILPLIDYNDNTLLISVGISGIYPIEKIHVAYKEALDAVKLSGMTKSNCNITDFNKLGLYRLLASIDNDKETWDFLSKTIVPLIRYDKENLTKYVSTLEAFLEYGIKEGSKTLYIHPNTLRYRLKKIEEITGKSLDDYNDSLDLQIGLKLNDLLNKKTSSTDF